MRPSLPKLVLLALFVNLFMVPSFSQSWQWAKNDLVVNDSSSFFTKSVVDSESNTIATSLRLGAWYFSKHDKYGNLLWTRRIVVTPRTDNTGNAGAIRAFSVDYFNNIYIISTPLISIDSIETTTPGPFALVKLDKTGKLMWAKQIDFEPLGEDIIPTENRLILILTLKNFSSLKYEGQTFSNLAHNNPSKFIASLDTSGALHWARQLYIPHKPPFCNSTPLWTYISSNNNNQLLIAGKAREELILESSSLLSTDKCQDFYFGLMLDRWGNLKWAKKLDLDTLPAIANLKKQADVMNAQILSNGSWVFYRYGRLDSFFTTHPNEPHPRVLINKWYLYDSSGSHVQTKTDGSLGTGYYRATAIAGGENNSFYTSGFHYEWTPTVLAEMMQVNKWDTSLHTLWEKRLKYYHPFPIYHTNDFNYRNNGLSFVMQSSFDYCTCTDFAYFGNDTIRGVGNTLLVRMADSANFISGSVFIDTNKNATWDAGEPAAQGVIIGDTRNEPRYAVSRGDGKFEFIADPGKYNFKPLNLEAAYPNWTLAVPAFQSANITGYGNYVGNKSFALQAAADITDGAIAITPYTRARPGFPFGTIVEVTNAGTTNFSGHITVQFDTTKMRHSLTINGAVMSYDTIRIPVSTLRPFQKASYYVNFRIYDTTALHDTLKIVARLKTDVTDLRPFNNIDSSLVVVRGAFDPNDKQVLPFKDVNYDSVIAGRQELDYLIRFQNTGTDTAFNVWVRDTIDQQLDMNSFRLISTSHPVEINFKQPRGIEFHFRNIQLPDSNVNEPLSHGYIRFRIKPKTGVHINTIITNDASIYFDYNLPVLTNWVRTNFLKYSVVTDVPAINLPDKKLQIVPNPAGSELYFTVKGITTPEKTVMRIYDAAGRLVVSTAGTIANGRTIRIDISSLNKGLYYLEVSGKKLKYVGRFIRE